MPEYNRIFRWVGPKTTILNAASAVGVGAEVDVSQFKHIGVAIIGAGTPPANFTVKCQGSVDVPANVAFGTAPSGSNIWDYVGMYDLEDGSFIDGDTGVSFSGANDVRQFTVNADELRTLCFEVTGYTAGNVTVIVFPMNNQ